MGKITLVTGGVRSGKSSFALSYASSKVGTKVFIATAVAIDDEMRTRIENHQAERGKSFFTIEAPYDLSGAISLLSPEYSIAVVDCLTVWLGNLFYKFDNDMVGIQNAIDTLPDTLLNASTEIILVTNEVGWGIVPENKMAREFRDCSGLLNQKIAKIADTVVLCVSGIPITIKGQKDCL